MEQKLRKMQEKLLIGGVTIQDRTSHQEKVEYPTYVQILKDVVFNMVRTSVQNLTPKWFFCTTIFISAYLSGKFYLKDNFVNNKNIECS